MIQQAIVSALNAVIPALDGAGIAYAITGSVASSLYGEPYASIDVDVACRMSRAQAHDLAGRIPARFYCSREMLENAAEARGMANLIDNETGLKLDISVLPADRYFDEVLLRRRIVELGPGDSRYPFVSPEDVVLMKLLWRKASQSVKQWENALSVVRIQRNNLDWRYLLGWAAKLGLRGDIEQLRLATGV